MINYLLFNLTKDINDIYKNLSINGLLIDKEEKNTLLNKVKTLIDYENEIYSYLTYDEIKNISNYFDNDNMNEEISERIINKLDELIITKYIDEFYLDNTNEEYEEYEKKLDRCSLVYLNTLKRDLFYLKIYFLNKFKSNNGYIGNGIYLNDFIINESINSNIFTYCSLFPYIESEVLKNNYIVNDYYLNSKLVKEMSLLDENICNEIKEDALKEEFVERLDIIIEDINKNNFIDLDICISLLDCLAHILSVLVLDKSYLKYVNNIFAKTSNELIYYIIYDNLNQLNEDKKNIKVLSLRNKE